MRLSLAALKIEVFILQFLHFITFFLQNFEVIEISWEFNFCIFHPSKSFRYLGQNTSHRGHLLEFLLSPSLFPYTNYFIQKFFTLSLIFEEFECPRHLFWVKGVLEHVDSLHQHHFVSFQLLQLKFLRVIFSLRCFCMRMFKHK